MTLVAYCYPCLSDSRTCEEDNLLNVIDECYQSENNHAKVNVKNTLEFRFDPKFISKQSIGQLEILINLYKELQRQH
jgi:hypothetical protein